MTEPSSRQKGMAAEDLAAKFLENRGYHVVERNWTFGKLEIDLIATSRTHIVFVEVKSRFGSSFGQPWEAVNSMKRRLIVRAADAYLKRHDSALEPRFDIISIVQRATSSEIEHIEAAFVPVA